MTADVLGARMHDLMARLFPICRSITGNGVRQTLATLSEVSPLDVVEVPSGTQVLDWVVPDEWNVTDAYVADAAGNRVIDFRRSNLHLVGYSTPFQGRLTLDELQQHLHSRPDLPDAIPYVTSYYERKWGFCLSQRERDALAPGTYEVAIDSEIKPGALSYGEIVIPGTSSDEVLLATNVCHPSMANNELSGPVLLIHLAKWLRETKAGANRLTYRLLFLPETIGAITYLARHGGHLKANVVAGFQVVCVGGPGPFTLLHSRRANTLADRIAKHVLGHHGDFREVGFPERGSDERQWCSIGFDLPVASIMRSKYHDYAAYHTSLDDLAFVRPGHLAESFEVYTKCIDALEHNKLPAAVVTEGEPNLGRRGLFSMTGGATHRHDLAQAMFAILAYADGETDLLAIADTYGQPIGDFIQALQLLEQADLAVAR